MLLQSMIFEYSRPLLYNFQLMNTPIDDNFVLQNNQHFLLRELQKFLHLYTDKKEKQTDLYFSLISCNEKMFQQIRNFLELVKKLKRSLQIIKINQQLDNNKNMIQNTQIQTQRQIPELIIKDIKQVRRTREENAVSVANKLKVLVCKTMQKQSSKLRFNYASYTSLLIQVMDKFHFDTAIEKMREEFDKIRRSFNVISQSIARLYRHHISNYILFGWQVDFFVSFYCQRLLFFQDQPLPFNGNILFVPITLVRSINRQTGKINHTMVQNWYINQLYKQNQNWQNYCLELIFRQNSTSKIKHYFCAQYQKKANENQTCSQLRKIRTFVYFSMIFNYLKHVIIQSSLSQCQRSIKIGLDQEFMLEINVERQHFDDKISNPKIIQDFLKYFEEDNIKNRAEINQYQITQNLKNYLLCTLTKIKYQVNIPEDYINLKPKYIYVGDKRVQI